MVWPYDVRKKKKNVENLLASSATINLSTEFTLSRQPPPPPVLFEQSKFSYNADNTFGQSNVNGFAESKNKLRQFSRDPWKIVETDVRNYWTSETRVRRTRAAGR